MSAGYALALLALAGALVIAERQRALAALRLGGDRARRSRAAVAAWQLLAAPVGERLARTHAALALAGDGKTGRRFLAEKLACAVCVPAIPLLPLAALEGRPPSPLLVPPLALAGFFVPDLSLARALKARRERILLDLPDALSMLALALAAGRSLHQALGLAARECGGPLGDDITTALTRARREPGTDERAALVDAARGSGEPSFARFAELLARKESPYLDFLRTQAAQARAEQGRVLERAADRAYLAMHAPLAPLLTTLVLLVSYGFLHLLDHSI